MVMGSLGLLLEAGKVTVFSLGVGGREGGPQGAMRKGTSPLLPPQCSHCSAHSLHPRV